MAKQVTIHGYENHRYFVPASNPYGEKVWFPTRAERDAAVAELERAAARDGLDSPHFKRISLVIRTEAQYRWLDRLQDAGTLRANGIDGPGNGPWHSWQGDAS